MHEHEAQALTRRACCAVVPLPGARAERVRQRPGSARSAANVVPIDSARARREAAQTAAIIGEVCRRVGARWVPYDAALGFKLASGAALGVEGYLDQFTPEELFDYFRGFMLAAEEKGSLSPGVAEGFARELHVELRRAYGMRRISPW